MGLITNLANRFLRPSIAIPAIVAAVSVIELAIADRKYGLFTGGFGQSNAVDNLGELLLFGAGYLASQVAAALLIWALCQWHNRHRSGWPALYHFTFLFGGLGLGGLTAQYQLHSYFSDAVDFALLKQLGGGSLKDALLFGKNEIAMAAVALGILLLVWWAGWRIFKRLLGLPAEEPGRQASRRWLVTAWFAFIAMLAVIPRTGNDAAIGLERMLVWRGVGTLASAATEFDGDGYGLFGLKTDAHPFDAARHPLALDVPGNGIDEDGYGGDLVLSPVPEPLPETVPVAATESARPQHVVLVVMESTRFDVLGKRIDGKPVAPNLEALAASGTAIAPAYSHVGFTTASLKSIFSGRLAPKPGDPSLFTELRKAGYRIGVFSGQPEDFGDISETVGMRRNADLFVDAERLKDKRAFSFAAQGSLLVDEGVLLGEFDRLAGDPRGWQRPNFLYFNFQSPHFPYDHPGVPHRFANPPIARGEIAASRRDAVERTYWNAVANADANLGALVERLKRLGVWNDTILLVTGDHGESLFEDGFLGHGHIINQRQFATFLVANRPLPGVSAPIVISDYRALLHGLLSGKPTARQELPPFMHIGELDRPSAIGLAATPYGIVSLKLDSGKVCFERPAHCRSYDALAGGEKASADALVRRWGSERRAAGQGGR
jgi:hypothetical protein